MDISILTDPDFLIALGTAMGIYSKSYALFDDETVWSRKSSLPNIVAYPITGLYPLWNLELYVSFCTTLITLLIWIGIYFFRSPDDENWIGK